MAFSYEWHSNAFSYKEKDAPGALSAVLQKKKKKKNWLNGHCDTTISTDAIESAYKKLKSCSEDTSPSKSQPKRTVESLLEGVISATQVKPAIKTTKKAKKLSVSFADNVKPASMKESKTSSNCNSVARNCSNTEGSKNKKKKQINVDAIEIATVASSKRPSKVKANDAIEIGTVASSKHPSKVKANDAIEIATVASSKRPSIVKANDAIEIATVASSKRPSKVKANDAIEIATVASSKHPSNVKANDAIEIATVASSKRPSKVKANDAIEIATVASSKHPSKVKANDAIEIATVASSKHPANVKANDAIMNDTAVHANGSHTSQSESITDSTILKKRKKKAEKSAPKAVAAESLEFKDADSPSHLGPSMKKRKINLAENSPRSESFSKKELTLNKELAISKEEKVDTLTAKKKTLESNDDEGEWEDLNCDVDWDSIEDDDEVLDYANGKEPELDEQFHSDLQSLIAELNFDAVKKETSYNDSEEEAGESGLDEEAENSGTEEDNADNSSHGNQKRELSKKLETAPPVDGNVKSVTNGNQKKTASFKEVSSTCAAALPKISASLAKYGMPGITEHKKQPYKSLLAQQMAQKLNVAKFRMINEQLYKTTSQEAQALFKDDPDSFHVYHEGFKSQVALWPLKPLDIIVDWLKLQDSNWTVADFGCGEGELADRVKQKVHSLDLVALRPHITVCDMAHTPLKSQSTNVGVFCLSLMGTNVSDFIREANRVLKPGGVMKIAEVESRISNVEEFVANVQKFGFKCCKKPVNHNYFITFDFKKVKDIKNRSNLPEIRLKPCLYKKR